MPAKPQRRAPAQEPAPPRLEASLRKHATDHSLRRGEAYFEEGAVVGLERRGAKVTAEVQGSRAAPYQVRLGLGAAGIEDAACSCPYDSGGWCKHIVATTLALAREPDRVEERPPLEELLRGLDRDALAALLLHFAEQDPSLAQAIEARAQAASLRAEPAASRGAKRKAKPRVDGRAVHRRVAAAIHSLDRMRSSEAYWHVGGVVDELRGIVDEARAFLDAGHAEAALTILDGITDAYVAEWTNLDGSDGDTGAFYSDIAEAWTEALLAADLSTANRDAWRRKLDAWQAEADDYGLEGVFDAAREAASQGWGSPALRSAKRKAAAPRKAPHDPEDEEDEAGEALVGAALKTLRRQGRDEEFLELAERAGRAAEHAGMLVQQGKHDEALRYGLKRLRDPGDAQQVAEALWEAGAKGQALRLAEHALRSKAGEDDKAFLAAWLRDAAEAMGKRALALEAADVAFRGSPSLEAFEAARGLAGKGWPALREQLLAHLQRSDALPHERVAILLREGLAEDAMRVADEAGMYSVVEPVVDAVLKTHPDWAVRACREQAEPIMDGGRSRQYHHAVRWLEKARAAHLAAGREAAWRAYLEALLARHKPKHKLRAMLQRLA